MIRRKWITNIFYIPAILLFFFLSFIHLLKGFGFRLLTGTDIPSSINT